MRALWSLAIVCLVAATGVRPAEALTARGTRDELRATEVVRSAPLAARALVSRPAPHASTGRAAPELQLPPVALATAFSLWTPPGGAIAPVSLSCDRVFVCLALTCSARGPPIA